MNRTRKHAHQKLCYVLPFYRPDTGTHYYHLYELLGSLTDYADIYLYVEKAPADDVDIAGITGKHIQRYSLLPFRLLEMFFVLLRIRFAGYKKFYIHYSTLPAIVGSAIVRVFGGKTFYWSCVQNKAFFAKWQWDIRSIKQKLLADIPTTLALKHSSHIVTCSEFMKQYYTKEFGVPENRILVICNWVNLSRFTPPTKEQCLQLRKKLAIPDGSQVLLHINTIGKHKGVHFLPEIVRRVSATRKDLVLVICGDGDYLDTLKAEIGKAGLDSIVRFVGRIPNRETIRYLSIADIFIYPALREAFGRVLLEVMAAGVPFVASDGGGGILAFTSSLQQEYIVPVGDLDAFSQRVAYLVSNPEERVRLKNEGLRVVSEYSLEMALQRFKETVLAT